MARKSAQPKVITGKYRNKQKVVAVLEIKKRNV